MQSKKEFSERDICTKYITPAIEAAGWDKQTQLLEEVSFTDGKIYVRGKLTARGKRKRADYILYYKPNVPIAIIEAKDNKHHVGDGMQQALEYSEILHIPFVFTSNGDSTPVMAWGTAFDRMRLHPTPIRLPAWLMVLLISFV